MRHETGARGGRASPRTEVKERPSVSDLMAEYAVTQEKLWSSFVIKAQEKAVCTYSWIGAHNVKRPKTHEWRWDGATGRFKHIQRSWGWDPGKGQRSIDNKAHNSWLWDGKRFYSYVKGLMEGDKDPPGYPGKLFLDEYEEHESRKIVRPLVHSEPFSGYVYYKDDGERIDEVILRDRNAFVQPGMEIVGQSKCYVVSAVPEKGRHIKVWIDARHGYSIAKYEHRITEGYVAAGGNRFGKGEFESHLGTVVNFKKIGGLWVPMEIDTEHELKRLIGGDTYQRVSIHYRRTEFILNPDHDALGSFVPDDVMDGAVVFGGYTRAVHSPQAPRYKWEIDPEYVADANGCVVKYNSDKNMPKVVKTLPSLDHLGLKVNAEQIKDKRILACFWDKDDEPSRRLLLTLRDRREDFSERGMLVILVECTCARHDDVRSWTSQNKVAFPVGRFDFEKGKEYVARIHESWAIASLPRLVLTDTSHVVTAEGFGLDELDTKMKEVGNAME